LVLKKKSHRKKIATDFTDYTEKIIFIVEKKQCFLCNVAKTLACFAKNFAPFAVILFA
jgi:hypothetical protein